jgi:hypothetical protein
MHKWTGIWYYDCWTNQRWHGKSGQETVDAEYEVEARDKIASIGRRKLQSQGCPPMILTYHLHVRNLKKSTSRY